MTKIKMPESKITLENGNVETYKAELSFESHSGQAPYFAVTADVRIWEPRSKAFQSRWGVPGSLIGESWGMNHESFERHFPHLTFLLKWHLTSTKGPLHYLANSIYWAEQGNWDHFKSSAVWGAIPSDTDLALERLQAMFGECDLKTAKRGLRLYLLMRFEPLMAQFQKEVLWIFYTYQEK